MSAKEGYGGLDWPEYATVQAVLPTNQSRTAIPNASQALRATGSYRAGEHQHRADGEDHVLDPLVVEPGFGPARPNRSLIASRTVTTPSTSHR